MWNLDELSVCQVPASLPGSFLGCRRGLQREDALNCHEYTSAVSLRLGSKHMRTCSQPLVRDVQRHHWLDRQRMLKKRASRQKRLDLGLEEEGKKSLIGACWGRMPLLFFVAMVHSCSFVSLGVSKWQLGPVSSHCWMFFASACLLADRRTVVYITRYCVDLCCTTCPLAWQAKDAQEESKSPEEVG